MKNILLLGATGTAGSAITKELLKEEDIHITLFARHASQVIRDSEQVTIVDGDATSLNDLHQVMKNQDVVYCAISGEQLPLVAENIVKSMKENAVERIIFMGAIGIYNEIPEEVDGKDNVDQNEEQIPNRLAVDIIENSQLNYTIIRPGFLEEGDSDDYVLSLKGEMVKGYQTTISSVVQLAIQLIKDEQLYSHQSVAITKDATQ
ncbi:MAG: NAD(P)H-binding protein [Thomasclavelia ramosa]|nr:NAD(P)H-binding protein [Thomasclavelia ramosa]